jgi:DNA-binding NtrC family response regulator
MIVKEKVKILIVEDEFIVANDLKIMLTRAGFSVVGIAASVSQARRLIELKHPDWILLDIMLKGDQTGIDLGRELMREGIPFIYISANTNQRTLEDAKTTQPYGFLVKPFRERDLFVMLDIASYKFSLETGKITVPQGNSRRLHIPDIIGKSPGLENVIKKIKMVAPVNTSVLIIGESGTGKEKVALAIHQQSTRSTRPMITVNCAALPLSLIESELFGHEKGAFTGAGQRRIGKFEQANGGTIFLDEVGELPLDAQVKLLRVLQEKEIERIGGDEPIKIDVRIIAATNRKLEKEVGEGRFRLDLYYRLNVFPIEVPPLRERKDDIEELTHYFIEKFKNKSQSKISGITEYALTELKQYHWPGNIRELEHLIERSMIMAMGNEIEEIQLPLHKTIPEQEGRILTLEEMEKTHILNALKLCNGKVSGGGGAAEALGLPAATLYSKLKKLGIRQEYI